jgi:hypothetical protein
MNQLFKNGQRRSVAEIYNPMAQFAPASTCKKAAAPVEPRPMGRLVNSPQAQLNNPVTDSVQLFLNELRSGVGIEQSEGDFSLQSAVGPGQPEPGFVPAPDGVLRESEYSFHPIDTVGNIGVQTGGTGSIPEHGTR